jgi:hypothetical protein
MSDDQKEIGSILIEMNDKSIDRFFSLIEFTVVVITLYATLAVYKLQEIIESLQQKVNLQITTLALFLCILSVIMVLSYSISQIQSNEKRPTLFKNNDGLIQFKNEQELSEQNKYLFSLIDIQNDTFISSFLLLVCSSGFFYDYLLQDKFHFLQVILFYPFLVVFIGSIALKYRRNLKALYRRQENEITG